MPLILCLESSSEVCSIAICKGGEILSSIETTEAFSHTRKMTLFIQECLIKAQIDIQDLNAIAVSDGPGSYTGLRVSASTAKGLCFALKIPLVKVNTLEAIAAHAIKLQEADIYIPMIDARRMEVYTMTYDTDLNVLKKTYNLIIEEDSFEAYKDKIIVLCGTGVEKTKEVFKTKTHIFLPFQLSATYLAPIANQKFHSKEFENIVSYAPNYFKAPKVTKSKKPLF